MHALVYTEPITSLLAYYRTELVQHPLFTAAQQGELSKATLERFAFHQYSDSITWIPMLAQMKAKAVRSCRLRQAIADNIACEAGLHGTSHVVLAVELMRSLGITRVTGEPFVRLASEWLTEQLTEPQIAGWLLVAESLVPVMFGCVLPSFQRLGCDTTYFAEHIHVDDEEHATWMAEAVDDVIALYGTRAVADVIAGMHDGWQETMEVPDALWHQPNV